MTEEQIIKLAKLMHKAEKAGITLTTHERDYGCERKVCYRVTGAPGILLYVGKADGEWLPR